MKVLVKGPFNIEKASKAAPNLEIKQVNDETSLFSNAHDADIILMMSLGWIESGFPALLNASPKLKWFHCSSAGVDPLICPELVSSNIILTSAKGFTVGPLLAEHAFALMLSLSRGIVEPNQIKQWNPQSNSAQQVYEIAGKTLGVVGFGGTGKALALRAQSFGMEVIAIRLNPASKSDFVEWGPNRFLEMLEIADFVVIAVPDTPDTKSMFNSEAFFHMKNSAILINVGRGQTVETDALVDALINKKIAGAGLDVVNPEPLPPNHPLWKIDNVIVTPHIAGNSPERTKRNETTVLENLSAFCNGLPLKNTVDLKLGY